MAPVILVGGSAPPALQESPPSVEVATVATVLVPDRVLPTARQIRTVGQANPCGVPTAGAAVGCQVRPPLVLITAAGRVAPPEVTVPTPTHRSAEGQEMAVTRTPPPGSTDSQ